jgi:hypothetical protein
VKALYCGACGDFVALQDEVRSCKCQRVLGRWFDGGKGLALFAEAEIEFGQIARDLAKDGDPPEHAWLLGVSNSILRSAHARVPRPPNFLEYRDWQNADGTFFKTYESNIVRMRPGATIDTSFVTIDQLVSREWPEEVSTPPSVR